MEYPIDIHKPSKDEQITAMASYDTLRSVIDGIKSDKPEIEIQETNEKIILPIKALKLLSNILKATSEGKIISLVPIAAEMTTQAAAEFLGCSRPHLVKLLEEDKIPFTKIGKHRRVKFEDIRKYKEQIKSRQKEILIDIMKSDEESRLYDS